MRDTHQRLHTRSTTALPTKYLKVKLGFDELKLQSHKRIHLFYRDFYYEMHLLYEETPESLRMELCPTLEQLSKRPTRGNFNR